jgi:hypothetical protein
LHIPDDFPFWIGFVAPYLKVLADGVAFFKGPCGNGFYDSIGLMLKALVGAGKTSVLAMPKTFEVGLSDLITLSALATGFVTGFAG